LGLGLGVEDIRKVLQKKCSRDVLTVQYIGLYLGVELNVPTELATKLDETLNLGCKLNVGFLPLAQLCGMDGSPCRSPLSSEVVNTRETKTANFSYILDGKGCRFRLSKECYVIFI
jgi:hypothetical protein